MALFVNSISSSGWLLHPRSLYTINHKTVYLARPGFPSLIEVQEKDKFKNGQLFVNEIGIKFDSQLNKLVQAIGLSEIIKQANEISLMLDEHRILLKDLI